MSDPDKGPFDGDTFLRRQQLQKIIDLKDAPLSIWGSTTDEIGKSEDISCWWTRVGIHLGWPGSNHFLDFDVWMCAEFHRVSYLF